MIFIYIIVAIFIAWIWVDYYRLIDIYENERLKYFALTFFLGCASVLIVIGLNRYVLDRFPFELNGIFINDFLYCVFKIGLVEELAKTIPFLIMFLLFKKEINEPIDYLAFICVSALGFSAAENAMYFQNHGPNIINNRAILSTVGHMFDTSLIAYGIIRYKYHSKKQGVFGIIFFFFLAALSHGFYDFWLMYEVTKSGGWLITIFYFLVTISFFAVILNNALNNSTFFSYKKVVDSKKVATRLLTYYAIVFLIQFVLLVFLKNFNYAMMNMLGSFFFAGIIIVVACIRLSRFKLIKGKWEDIKIELPFTISQGDPYGMNSSRFRILIKGESFNEAYISVFFEEYFSLNPLSKKNTYLGNPKLTFIEKKLFLKDEQTFYLAKVFYDSENGKYETMLLKPKTNSITMVNGKYPIVAVLKIDKETDIEDISLSAEDFRFKEWAFIKPRLETKLEKL